MKCLIYYYQRPDAEILKNHYIFYHQINKNNYFFKKLFQPDNQSIHSKKCDDCQMQFRNHKQTKDHSFLVHREQ